MGEIKIGDNCFIGARAIILPGVTLGNECVVAAGAVVTKSYPSGSVLGGNPAKLIGNSKELVVVLLMDFLTQNWERNILQKIIPKKSFVIDKWFKPLHTCYIFNERVKG